MRRPAPGKLIAEDIDGGALLTEQDVAEALGLSPNRVRWLALNGHLRQGVTRDGRVRGFTKESVEREHNWRSSATRAQRLRRLVSYAFTWLP